MNLFDYAKVREARDNGIKLSADNSGDDWARYASAFVLFYLKHHETMHCDDLWKAGLREPSSPRALGQVIREAVKNDWIEAITTAHGVVARPSVRSRYGLKQVCSSKVKI